MQGLRAIVALAAMAILGLAACQPKQAAGPDPVAVDSVRAASAAWDMATNAGDVDRLMALYARSAVSMPNNRTVLDGWDAIAADMSEFHDHYTAIHKTTIVSLDFHDDLAIERGSYLLTVTPKTTGGSFMEAGKHLVIRQKIDGAWLIQWEIWNTDAPAPAP